MAQTEERSSESPSAAAEEEAAAAGNGSSGGKGDSEEEVVSLGEILGLLFIVCCILYCIGISYKIIKIIKGTYVEEEPVYLKYK